MAEPQHVPGEFCERCQLPLIMCAHRRPGRAAAVTAGGPPGPDWDHIDELAEQGFDGDSVPFGAQYGGRCRGCGERWDPDDMIAWSAGEGGLVHAECVG